MGLVSLLGKGDSRTTEEGNNDDVKRFLEIMHVAKLNVKIHLISIANLKFIHFSLLDFGFPKLEIMIGSPPLFEFMLHTYLHHGVVSISRGQSRNFNPEDMST